LGEVEGYEKAIDELKKMKDFSENCHYNTSIGEMYLKAGNKLEAKKYFSKALSLTHSNAETELISRKINACVEIKIIHRNK
jgi:predicted negative regulator of RcsB-dependent stress response